jgi:DNA (cytosine-5)-methyltransferase 1
MDAYIYIPASLRAAGRQLRLAEGGSLERLRKREFLRAWCSIHYLFPGLHPDTFFTAQADWPKRLKSFAAEAWRRFQAGELTDNEFYCYQAATTRIQRECVQLQRVKPWLFRDYFAA